MLEVRDLKKNFGDLAVLRGVSLEMQKGDVTAIIGPSGGGKTTLLRCINFLERADSGTLVFDGQSYDLAAIGKRDIAAIRMKTGFVFQSFNLFSNKTAVQNVTEGLTVARRKDAQGPGQRHRHAGLGAGRAQGSGRSLSQPAFRRPAAARGHCPRPGHEPRDHLF